MGKWRRTQKERRWTFSQGVITCKTAPVFWNDPGQLGFLFDGKPKHSLQDYIINYRGSVPTYTKITTRSQGCVSFFFLFCFQQWSACYSLPQISRSNIISRVKDHIPVSQCHLESCTQKQEATRTFSKPLKSSFWGDDADGEGGWGCSFEQDMEPLLSLRRGSGKDLLPVEGNHFS